MRHPNVMRVAGLILALWSCHVSAAMDPALELDLNNAMRLKKGSTGRLGDSGKVIQAYMRERIVSKRPNQRADYTDYYLVKQPRQPGRRGGRAGGR